MTGKLRTDADTRPSGARLLLAVGAWIAGSVVVGFATFALAKAVAPGWAANPDNLAVVITTEVYGLLVASLLLIARGGSRTRTVLALRRASRRDIASALVALGVVYAVSAVIYVVVELIASPDPSVLDIILGIGSDGGRLADAGFWATALIFFRVLILVPLGEELLFRGALFSWIRARLPAWATIGITAAAFAVIHQFLIILPAAMVFGVAMGWVRERTASTLPAIVAHGVSGLVLMILSLLATDWTASLPF